MQHVTVQNVTWWNTPPIDISSSTLTSTTAHDVVGTHDINDSDANKQQPNDGGVNEHPQHQLCSLQACLRAFTVHIANSLTHTTHDVHQW